MNDDPGDADDISQLWAADGIGAWEPAPRRRPVPPAAAPDGNSNAQTGRLDALEQDVRALVQVVERVELVVSERLSRLEQRLADVTERAAAEERRGHTGMSRLSGVIKATRRP